MTDKYDAIVIGAGHNGLVCSAILAKAGRRVLVLEANEQVGGFSRLYRKGGRYGPHWFDYSDVTTEPKWSDLEGYYTRYGDVRPLLLESDDMYVIVNAGDQLTVEFDAAEAPELPDGWTRTFLIYTDGWIKDGDLNTATGQTVEPLPFHSQSRYPHRATSPASGAGASGGRGSTRRSPSTSCPAVRRRSISSKCPASWRVCRV